MDADRVAEAEVPARGRGRHRVLVGVAAAVALLALAYLALLLVAPRIDRLHVARGGWTLHRCARLGGSIPVDFPAMVGMHSREVGHRSLVAVSDGDQRYVAAPVRTSDGREDVGVWVTANELGGLSRPARAANDVAAEVADNPDGRAASPSADLVAAATSCAERAP